RINLDGSGYSILHRVSSSDGKAPWGGTVVASDAALYGTTHDGGSNGLGTIFKMNQDGSGYRVLYNFTGAAGDASSPAAGLFEADDGALYGTTWYGGSTWNGTVFRVNRDGSNYAVVYSFLETGGEGGARRAS